MQKTDKNTSFAELIRGFLEEVEIVAYNEMPSSSEIAKHLKQNNFPKNGISSNQLGCVSEREQSVFAFYSKNTPIETVLKELIQGPFDELGTLHVVFFAATIQDLMEVEKARNEILKLARKRVNTRRKVDVKLYKIHAPQKENTVFSIGIDSRIRTLHHKSESKNGVAIESMVYKAKLYDIVEMYSQVGAELFERNVRYHIKDVLNVESEIQKTLRKNPIEFFNLNNGIAMQVKDASLLDQRHEQQIRVEYKKGGDISVINGAQTLCAAAEFFFKPLGAGAKDEEIKEAIQLAKEKAYVLLRVFYPEKGTNKDCLAAFEQISISLNRQKPINPIDVQYTCPEVVQINALYAKEKTNPFFFRLLKRGQKTSGLSQYQLSEFGRMVKAYYFNKPGQARAESIQSIIKHQSADDIIDGKENNTIYAPFDLNSTSDSADNALFMKWYKPVNFANEIAKSFAQVNRQNRSQENSNQNLRIILNNGRYFFIAYVVQMLNDAPGDFTNFPYGPQAITHKEEQLKAHITAFVELVAAYADTYLENPQAKKTVLEANDFKKEDFYKAWCDFAEQDEKVHQWNITLQSILKAEPANGSAQ